MVFYTQLRAAFTTYLLTTCLWVVSRQVGRQKEKKVTELTTMVSQLGNCNPPENPIFKKSSKKRNKNPSRYYNSITNLIFQKSQYKNKWTYYYYYYYYYYLGAYRNPLSYYNSIMNLNTTICLLPWQARPIKKDLMAPFVKWAQKTPIYTFNHHVMYVTPCNVYTPENFCNIKDHMYRLGSIEQKM